MFEPASWIQNSICKCAHFWVDILKVMWQTWFQDWIHSFNRYSEHSNFELNPWCTYSSHWTGYIRNLEKGSSATSCCLCAVHSDSLIINSVGYIRDSKFCLIATWFDIYGVYRLHHRFWITDIIIIIYLFIITMQIQGEKIKSVFNLSIGIP